MTASTFPSRKMADVAEVVAGTAFPKHLQGRPEGRFPVFKVGEISRASQAGQIVLHYSLNNVGPGDLKGKALPSGTVVFAKIGEALKLNRRAILGRAAFIDNNVMGLIPRAGVIDSRYLYYFSLSLDLSPLSQATAVPSIRKSDVLEISVPTPSLPEQARVVEEIEKQFTRLDAAVGALHRTRANLNRYRSSILEWSISPDPLTMKWPMRPLGDLLEGIQGGKSFRCETRRAEEGEWGVLKVSAVTWGHFKESEQKALPFAATPDPRLEVQEGDLLISRANTVEYVGRTAIVESCRPRLLLSDKTLRLKCNQEVIPRYLHLALATRLVRKQIERVATGTSDSMRNISQVKIRDLLVPTPPLERQREITDSLDGRLSLLKRLDDQVNQELRRAKNLRQAILYRAFSGTLTRAEG